MASVPNGVPAEEMARLSLSSKTVHADDAISAHRAVAPAMHVSTTFRYSDDPEQLKNSADPTKLGDWNNPDPNAPLDSHIYSRDSNPNTTRLEAVLSSILGGPSLTYASGLAAFHAMLIRLNPKRIAIGEGYHGCHGVIKVVSRLTGLQKLPLDCDPSELGPGDIIHVETPLNPTGEARNLQFYADKAHKAGAFLTVDATFAPPPLQNPFDFGADIIMHSGTKYIGGHSDMLCGVLAVRPGNSWAKELREERLVLGSVMGSMEGWLGLRSLRTLELRVTRQSQTAAALVKWLSSQLGDSSTVVGQLVEKLHHASLQPEAAEEGSWLRQQMPAGYGPVFAIVMKDMDLAKKLPSRLRLFHHATSLGGIESLIEWRAMTDPLVDQRLLRVSIGVEGFEDLKRDIEQAFESLKK
ncbi:trans-sulfuration enzyme [Metarhizium anisopliae BRIP 53293]|uniref:Trans-sulfuration enzyme n=1 Tax=Metarhizium anisopliae BRIP 53293 TaxID=1291518 RepID=A0A0D9P2I1_METAN|nr:trans-sulfuration enzyme [Metarhizium anisopliae BRIP 53293]KJK88803.1 trans-sulfuration enzyme [Metarhizium anisopliae BRIP 53284]